MNIEERIVRRQRTDDEPRLIVGADALNPTAHPTEPVGRGLVIEQLLDAIAPVFDGRCPDDCYLWGAKGTGKSAVVRSVFAHLNRLVGRSHGRMYTTTRAAPTTDVAFVYVDGREAKTEFALLHTVLNELTADPVPKQGVGAETVRRRLADRLDAEPLSLVVAVDHVEEPETLAIGTVSAQFATIQESVGLVAVGHPEPDEAGLGSLSNPDIIQCSPYRRHTLIEILTGRQADGLSRSAITHDQLRELAAWADGDAHDALAALFSAGLLAEQRDHDRVEADDLDAGKDAVPQPCVSLGRVLALPTSRRQLLYRLSELPETARNAVGTAADAIADDRIDLSRATIERVLYELAEAGIVRRLKVDDASQVGRPPSRLEPRFPTLVFRHLQSTD